MKIIILLFFPFWAFSQSLQERQDAKNKIVLLKNEGILPIKNLEKQKIGLILDQQQDFSEFLAILQKYTNIEIIQEQDYEKYNFLIICKESFLAQKKAQTWLYCHFSEQKIPKKSLLADAILQVPHTKIAQNLAAQIIFGGIGAEGKLAQKQGKFPKKHGLTSQGGIRLSYCHPQEAQIDSLQLYTKIDSLAQIILDSQAAPSVQLLVARNGKVILEKSYGFHTYEKLQKAQNSDLYDLASITKISAALPLAMQLYDQQKFDLDKPISQYLDFLKNSNKDSLTFREILTHQAGLKPWLPFWQKALEIYKKDANFFSKSYTEKNSFCVSDSFFIDKSFYDSIFTYIRDSQVGEKQYLYSDLALYLLMETVKKIQNEDFETSLYKNIFWKIGANNLVFNPLQKFPKSQIVPTEIDTLFRKKLVWGYVHDEGAALLGGVAGHAGLFSNANDLAKLMQVYLNEGSYGDEQLIQKNTINIFTDYQFYPRNRRALGFDKKPVVWNEESYISKYAHATSFGHSGFTGTLVWADPKTGILLVFLSNRLHPYRSQQNLYRLKLRSLLHDAIYEAIRD